NSSMTGEQLAAPSCPRDGEDVSITRGRPKPFKSHEAGDVFSAPLVGREADFLIHGIAKPLHEGDVIGSDSLVEDNDLTAAPCLDLDLLDKHPNLMIWNPTGFLMDEYRKIARV
ncbi:hypothetical protein C5167_003626, partial [Papaver somniferum]